MNEQDIYTAAMAHYGEPSQYDKLIEEMAELTHAILKARRRNSPTLSENLHEEFVDVQIVMAQFERILLRDRLDFWKDIKLKRLEERIKNHE